MKIRVWYLINDCGDGSFTVSFFKTEAEYKKQRVENSEYEEYSLDQNGTYYKDITVEEHTIVEW